MQTTEELLAQMEAEAQSETPVCIIDPDTRTITVPPEYQLFGVENDKRVERLYFQCPKIVGDNQDLSQDYQLFVNYQNANGDPDAYKIEDMQVDGDNITFSWLLEENVTKYRGDIQFAFGAIKPGDEAEDPDKNRWNTTINADCTCLVGLKCTQQVAESNPDALAQIWAAIDELKAGGGGSGTPGKDGVGIDRIEKTSTQGLADTYTIYLTDDRTYTFTVTNGKDGNPGQKGDPGQTGATPNIQIGTVQTLEPGQQATASMTGTPENPLLNLGIPKGEKGDPGEDAESGESYTLPIMSDTQLGGGKAVAKTDEDVPVAVDPSTGQLFVPTYPENTGGGGGTVDPEQIKQAVNSYLEKNPVSGMTEEQEQQLNQNTSDVSNLKSALERKGLPAGGTLGQVLVKKSDENYDVEWKDELTGTSDQYFEVVKQVASSNVFLEQQPDTFRGNDNWYYGNYGKPLYQATSKEQFYYNKLTFTGTIYIRCLTINQYSTPGLCSVYTCSSNVLPENWTEENGAVELLSSNEKTTQFTLEDKTGFVYVNNDGTYEINPSSKEETSPNNGYIVLLKYIIPEGKYGWIVFANAMGAGSSNSKWNEKGYPSVFTTSPIDNIVQDIFSVDSSSSDGQLQTKTQYTSGFMKFIAENSEFQSYISDKINSFLPLTAKKQTYGKSIYIGGDSLHQYAGGDGKTTEGFVTNWNKYLGFSNVKNDGYAGSTWTELTGGGGLKRAKDLISGGIIYDVIILAWGTNDDTGGNGTIDDPASDAEGCTMVAAMKWIITNLRNTFKSTAIGVVIPPPKNTEDGMETRGDLMVQVCELLHVPYVDMRQYVSISDLGNDTVHLGTGAGKYGAAEASLILRICQYGDTLYPGTTD